MVRDPRDGGLPVVETEIKERRLNFTQLRPDFPTQRAEIASLANSERLLKTSKYNLRQVAVVLSCLHRTAVHPRPAPLHLQAVGQGSQHLHPARLQQELPAQQLSHRGQHR